MTSTFIIEPLSPGHNREAFLSDSEALDRYLKTQANQDIRRRISNCFVATPDSILVGGYYTLAAASLPMLDLPDAEKKRLPRYPVMPAALIGRLAVDRHFRGKGLGGALLFDAITRSMKADPAVFALVVDAKDVNAVGFYSRYGFQPFVSKPLSMFLPLATAAKLTGSS